MIDFDSELLEKVKFGPALHRDGTMAPDLIDVVFQSNKNKQVLFAASMNVDTLKETLETGFAVLYSRSRKCRWLKGETSGNKLKVVRIYLNCDNNQLLLVVEPQGRGVCHEVGAHGNHKPTCFSKLLARP